MAAADNATSTLDLPLRPPAVVDAVSDSLPIVSLQPDSPANNKESPSVSPRLQNARTSRPLIMYTRSQLLHLQKSPSVKMPDGMPAFKDWFGTESDQANVKKDSETSTPSGNARERRFRRDADDGTSTRASFRGAAITQPSQMGNFKHQSIRTADRDRDRERDVDREDRDSKGKEGQGSLRNLSDKYDRDRRAISSMTQLRNKDRELASHLANTGSRVTAQSQTTGSRAADGREPSRKKDVDSPEDWRRGTESSRSGRPDNGRKDRDDRDRERTRSKVRDSSRSRQDGSLSTRDRDADRDREGRQGDGGNGHRRDRDDRDKEHDRESEVDDPRRWRDDGKRDERMAARRERDTRERVRERSTWDNGDRSDRRWAAEERDSRSKRANGRDRRAGDDAKDREERKDREKEPAWMDTYIPGSSGSGFGMPRVSGELDGIQAFKKELREKEQRNQSSTAAGHLSDSQAKTGVPTLAPEPHLDEIQLFKLMMKREEEKRKAESPLASSTPHPTQTTSENISVGDKSVSLQDKEAKSENAAITTPILALSKQGPLSQNTQPLEGVSDSSKPAVLQDTACSSTSKTTSSNGHESERHNTLISANSQLLQTSVASGLSSAHETPKPSSDIPANSGAPPNVAVGSRLLALGSRPPHGSAGPPRSTASQSPISSSQKSIVVATHAPAGAGGSLGPSPNDLTAQAAAPAELLQGHNGFYPFDDHRDATAQTPASSSAARNPLAFTGDRNALAYACVEQPSVAELGVGPLPGQPFDGVNPGTAAAKGSRFAKFFDGKVRDNNPAPATSKGVMGNLGTLPPQKGGLSHLNNADTRAMEDIFAMLSNSARQNIAPEISNLEHLDPHRPALQAPQLPQQLPGHGRIDSLYDSRLDDRNFVPDGMVPGLRSMPPRTRQNGDMFTAIPDEPMHFNVPRGSTAQVYPGAMPPLYIQHPGRGGALATGLPPQVYRGSPSPNPLASAQRLPPGLANLGGRPPHDPNQFMSHGSSIGVPNAGIRASPHGNAPTQQPFNNYQQAAGLGFGGGPQMGMPPHNPLQGLVHSGNLGTAQAQAQLLGLAATNGLPGGLRGPNSGFGPQAQPPHMMMRQHQHPQQQIPPHMLPLHLQQQGLGGANSQLAHDLMALLMSGARRAE